MLVRGLFLALAASLVHADVYMQYPPGSNNRLNEGGGNRNNNNRLMDTQNNAKGGYGYGGSNNNKAAPVNYMAGSKMSMAWTSQHSCGTDNAECQIVIQYMCSGTGNQAPAGVPAANGIGEGPIRDGTNGDSPDPNNPQATRGLHEPTSFYQACDQRERNKGLYTADQNLNGNDARRTRQNPDGTRSALECPEERDYYPYWAPTPWKDAMIMTNNLALCPWYQAESQNVKARGYCQGQTANGDVANNPADCAQKGGTWTLVQPFNIPPPECVAAPPQRDNHLGNGLSGYEIMANLTIPYGALNGIDDAPNCVYRLRYNITTGDTRVCEDKQITTKAACEAAGKIWSAHFLDSSFNDADLNSNPPLPDGNPKVNLGGALGTSGGTDSILELAVNTNQYGRTFQDRTHVFSIQSRPAGLSANARIHNLNVKGKRGNIVQTYPATEYDFHPSDLVVGKSDYVHIQWTGNDNTNNNGNNNGEGTDNEDRHNIVQISDTGLDVPLGANEASMFDVSWEWNPVSSTESPAFGGTRDKAALTKQFALSKQQGCSPAPNNNDQARNNCEKLNQAAATIDFGLLKFKPGNFSYMSSRNNNFSNRAQKAKLRVIEAPTTPPEPPVKLEATAVDSGDSNVGRVQLTWAPPGNVAGYRGTDGAEYWGYEQQKVDVAAYSVQYTIDGGNSWAPVTGCQSSQLSCTVDFLPAGTPVGFKVSSGNEAGWGAPTATQLVKTLDSSASLACERELQDKLNGKLSTGAIVSIVLGVLAAVALIAFGFFKMQAQKPPPPPSKGMA